MKYNAVITGDIINFTSLSDQKRAALMGQTETLIKSWVKTPNLAEVFRGDSYQLLLDDPGEAIKKSIQLICWFKINSGLGSRVSIGIGAVAYLGKSVLDSDGEAFHLSGRNFDKMAGAELLGIKTNNEQLNEQISVILTFVNVFINQWTNSQAEVIYLAIDGYTQTKMAEQLGIQQGAVNSRLKTANWKTIKEGIDYIIQLIKK